MGEPIRETNPGPIEVVHVVDAAGGDGRLWGKERVVLQLMEAQAASGEVLPRLWTLTPKRLTEAAAELGVQAESLAQVVAKNPFLYARAMRARLAAGGPVVVHSHGYKANLVSRLARATGGAMLGLVSTCHGWVETTLPLRAYNALDRWSSRFSDAVTVPSADMLARLPASAVAIANGVPDIPPADPSARGELRRRYGFAEGAFVAGMVGRLSPEKGVAEWLAAARRARGDDRLIWAVAGAGPLEDEVRAAAADLPNLRWVGYVDAGAEFFPAIDLYVQPSRTEGLSLALLEACRAGLPIVATRVGATDWAVRDDAEAVLVPPNDSEALARAVGRLAGDPDLRERLGQAARKRYEERLTIQAMHREYLDLYRRVAARVRSDAQQPLAEESCR